MDCVKYIKATRADIYRILKEGNFTSGATVIHYIKTRLRVLQKLGISYNLTEFMPILQELALSETGDTPERDRYLSEYYIDIVNNLPFKN